MLCWYSVSCLPPIPDPPKSVQNGHCCSKVTSFLDWIANIFFTNEVFSFQIIWQWFWPVFFSPPKVLRFRVVFRWIPNRDRDKWFFRRGWSLWKHTCYGAHGFRSWGSLWHWSMSMRFPSLICHSQWDPEWWSISDLTKHLSVCTWWHNLDWARYCWSTSKRSQRLGLFLWGQGLSIFV